jgi:hypothetical protein
MDTKKLWLHVCFCHGCGSTNANMHTPLSNCTHCGTALRRSGTCFIESPMFCVATREEAKKEFPMWALVKNDSPWNFCRTLSIRDWGTVHFTYVTQSKIINNYTRNCQEVPDAVLYNAAGEMARVLRNLRRYARSHAQTEYVHHGFIGGDAEAIGAQSTRITITPPSSPVEEPRAEPKAKVEPKTAPVAKVEPNAKVEPKIAPVAKVEPADKVEPKTAPVASVEPKIAPVAKVEPKIAPVAKVEPAEKVEPKIAPVANAEPADKIEKKYSAREYLYLIGKYGAFNYDKILLLLEKLPSEPEDIATPKEFANEVKRTPSELYYKLIMENKSTGMQIMKYLHDACN